MSRTQQELVEELFDTKTKECPDLASALERFKPSAPVIIRNLENIQGDERDVVIISFTYGPDVATGKVFQRFPLINLAGGWRRLNVLFTRARLQIVVSSMKSEQILHVRSAQTTGLFTCGITSSLPRPVACLTHPTVPVASRTVSLNGLLVASSKASASTCISKSARWASSSTLPFPIRLRLLAIFAESNATVRHIIHTPQRATATACAKKSSASAAGTSIASGPPTGIATARLRLNA